MKYKSISGCSGRGCKGFTLIELIIASSLGLVLVLMILSLLQQQIRLNQKNHQDGQSINSINTVFDHIEKSFDRASLKIESVGVSIESESTPGIHFQLISGLGTTNCLGTGIYPQSQFIEVYFVRNEALYCRSEYLDRNNQRKIDTQPLVSNIDGFQLNPFVVEEELSQDQTNQCLQGFDVSVLLKSNEFSRRYLAPGCVQLL